MGNDSFVSKLVQGLGAISAIAGIFTQYFLRNEFLQILKIDANNSYYDAFTLAGLILGIIIIVGLYSNRYSINNRFHFNKKAFSEYINSIRQQDPTKPNPVKEIKQEPLYVDGVRLAWILLFLSSASFGLIFYTASGLCKSIFYLIFILFTTYAATIFLLQLYQTDDWKRRETARRCLLTQKINEFFSPGFKILTVMENTTNVMYPVTTQIIYVEKKKYQVTADPNNPDKYFNIIEINEDTENNGK